MEKVIVNVAKTPTGYSSSIDILPNWILGMNGSFADFLKKLQESIDIYVEWAKEDGEGYPDVFDGNYEFEYKFDAESLLYCYDGILSRAAVSQITGINQRQLGHYICGRSQPKKEQKEKIINGFHKFRKRTAVCF